jgi:hypothetical protein
MIMPAVMSTMDVASASSTNELNSEIRNIAKVGRPT